jgi:hypothetical protein
MNANSNTIENKECDRCGNNKEPTGECFDCVISPSMVECGICYNLTQSPSRGFYCDHQVCGDCSNQITTCPFCRRPWDEEEEDDEEEDIHEQCDICGRPATAGLIDGDFICIECRDEEIENNNHPVVEYKYRCETPSDAEEIRTALGNLATDYVITRVALNVGGGRVFELPDCNVVFKSSLGLDIIRDIIRLIPDCHVALQTIQPIETYTGERNWDL